MSLLRVAGIAKQIGGEPVLKGISFTQEQAQNIAVAGETGSGKSTLLKIIAGLVQTDAGEVLFEGERVKGPEERLIPGHPGVAYLSQDFDLRHHYRVEEILEYANKLPEEEAEAIFNVCHIKHLVKRKSDQLSGGEKQRIAIARLLISSPKLLLLDEPFSNLDTTHKRILKGVIHDIGIHLGTSCMLISHDPLDTLSWADEIIVLKDGQIVQQGAPEQIYKQPLNEYTAALFGSYNLIPSIHLSLLSIFRNLPQNGKSLFIRPEQLRISTESSNSIKGLVSAVRYFGGFYELTILVEKYSLIVRTLNSGFKKGEQVSLSLTKDALWYI